MHRVAATAFALIALIGCGGATSRDPHGNGGSVATGGAPGSGGAPNSGGGLGSGGVLASGGTPGSGGTPSDFCNRSSDCELRDPGCCGGCEPVDINSLIAVNKNTPGNNCGSIACGACPSIEPNQSTRRFFMPTCVEHHCAAIDIRGEPITECTASTQCVLRGGTECCPRCDVLEPIAVSADANLSAAFCPDGVHPCPYCAADWSHYQALCTAGGRCEPTYFNIKN